MENYDPITIQKKLEEKAITQEYSQLKWYLKQHILKALKLFDQDKNGFLELINQLGIASILFERNFQKEAIKVLKAQKKWAIEQHYFDLAHYINIELCRFILIQDNHTTNRYQKLMNYTDESINFIDQQIALTKQFIKQKELERSQITKKNKQKS